MEWSILDYHRRPFGVQLIVFVPSFVLSRLPIAFFMFLSEASLGNDRAVSVKKDGIYSTIFQNEILCVPFQMYLRTIKLSFIHDSIEVYVLHYRL